MEDRTKKILIVLIITTLAGAQGGGIPPYTSPYWRSVIDEDTPVHQPLSADSTTFFHINDAAGTSVFNIDTTNKEAEIRSNSGTKVPTLTFYDTDTGLGDGDVTSSIDFFKSDGGGIGATTAIQIQGVSANAYGGSLDLVFKLYNEGGSLAERFRFTNGGSFVLTDGTTPAAYGQLLTTQIYSGAAGGGQPAVLFQNLDNWPDEAGRANVLLIQGAQNDDDNYLIRADGKELAGAATTRFTVLGDGKHGINEVAPETLLELTHATPYITLHNSTHEDTDGGRESRIIAKGEQSGGEETTLGYIEFAHDGAVDDPNGYVDIYVNNGTSATKYLRIDSQGGVFFYNLKSGINQAAAGAATDELWVDTDDDNTVKLGS